MGLTPEAEEAQERSMRQEQEEYERQAKQRENNEQLVEMLAKKFQTHPPHQCDDPRVPALERRVAELERIVGALSSKTHDTYRSGSGIVEPESPLDGLKFSLMEVVDVDFSMWDWKSYATPQKPQEFTAPQNLDTYPGGLLEYIVQCGRKNGFPRNRIAFKLMERISYGNWKTQEELCERILHELVNKHHQPLPNPDESESYYKINNIILNKRSSWITLPSGTWSLALYNQVSFEEETETNVKKHWYKAMELKLESEDVNTSNMNGEETEVLQESSTPIQGTVDNAQAEQEEEYPVLNLKNHEWRGREINLYIEAKQPYPNENPWYDITGYYTCGGEEVQFSQYTFDFYRYRDSAAIDMWKDHDKIVNLLYNAGIITKEKTYKSIGLEKKCICYRLTRQALAYAHRDW